MLAGEDLERSDSVVKDLVIVIFDLFSKPEEAIAHSLLCLVNDWVGATFLWENRSTSGEGKRNVKHCFLEI